MSLVRFSRDRDHVYIGDMFYIALMRRIWGCLQGFTIIPDFGQSHASYICEWGYWRFFYNKKWYRKQLKQQGK